MNEGAGGFVDTYLVFNTPVPILYLKEGGLVGENDLFVLHRGPVALVVTELISLDF